MIVRLSLRRHLWIVAVVIIVNIYLLSLMDGSVSGSWIWMIALAAAAILASSFYVGLVLGVGGGILCEICMDFAQEHIALIRNTRCRIVKEVNDSTCI